MAHNPVRWFEIYVQDMPRAKRFYESVFETRLSRLKSPESMAATGFELWGFPSESEKWGCSGALVKMEGVPSCGGGTLVYFGSDDCAVEEKKIPKAGGKIHRPKMSIGEYGFMTLAIDSEGNMIGIHSMK
jgi:predicted enzyme related to lactoylglutathione lyase